MHKSNLLLSFEHSLHLLLGHLHILFPEKSMKYSSLLQDNTQFPKSKKYISFKQDLQLELLSLDVSSHSLQSE